MTKAKDSTGIGRRGFLKVATFAGAASIASPIDAIAQGSPPQPASTKMAPDVSAAQAAAESAPPVA
jgi:hypothetical protein